MVADEVSNLAMRAADAAKDTAKLIIGPVKKDNDGSKLVTRTNEASTQVADSTAKVGDLVVTWWLGLPPLPTSKPILMRAGNCGGVIHFVNF